MANHKRKRRKKARAGCLMCKQWKSNGAPKEHHFKHGEQLQRLRSLNDYEGTDGQGTDTQE